MRAAGRVEEMKGRDLAERRYFFALRARARTRLAFDLDRRSETPGARRIF
jgi:hypothetical protein